MTEKTEVLPSFDGIDFDDGELDTEHITLARAIEEARTARDSTLELKREIEAELKVFRDAMSRELRARKRKIDLQETLSFSLVSGPRRQELPSRFIGPIPSSLSAPPS